MEEKKETKKTKAQPTVSLDDMATSLQGMSDKEIADNGRTMYAMRLLQAKRIIDEAIKIQK